MYTYGSAPGLMEEIGAPGGGISGWLLLSEVGGEGGGDGVRCCLVWRVDCLRWLAAEREE